MRDQRTRLDVRGDDGGNRCKTEARHELSILRDSGFGRLNVACGADAAGLGGHRHLMRIHGGFRVWHGQYRGPL